MATKQDAEPKKEPGFEASLDELEKVT